MLSYMNMNWPQLDLNTRTLRLDKPLSHAFIFLDSICHNSANIRPFYKDRVNGVKMQFSKAACHIMK